MKWPLPSLTEEQRARAREQDEVLVAVVVHVGEERLRTCDRGRDACGLGHVLEGAVALVAEEAVGQALGLGDVEVVQAVAVEVAHGHAVVAHAPRREDGVEVCGPVVEPRNELAAGQEVSPPRAASVASREDGGGARGCARCSSAVHSVTRQTPSAPRRQRSCQRPTRSRAPARLRAAPARSKRTIVRTSGLRRAVTVDAR